jgi:hypothetical protein
MKTVIYDTTGSFVAEIENAHLVVGDEVLVTSFARVTAGSVTVNVLGLVTRRRVDFWIQEGICHP